MDRMILRLTAVAAAAVVGLLACSPEKDATSSVPLQTLSSPLGPASSASAAGERPEAQPKEEGEKRSN
jgi:hypothetical protein